MKFTAQNHFARKVNTAEKRLHKPMRMRLAQAVERHQGFLITIAREQSDKYGIPIRFRKGRPDGWFADLHSAGTYGMVRAALAWQQKKIEGLRTTDFDGELRQGARVRVKHLASKITRYRVLNDFVMEKLVNKDIYLLEVKGVRPVL